MSIAFRGHDRYAEDWNRYSTDWDAHYGDRYEHLGDEWCDEGTAERRHENRVFAIAEPWLRPTSRVLEIGPGGGKWTVRIAPCVSELVVFDVADSMLARTRARCERHGLDNVACELGDGTGIFGAADETMDVVFSYDVFVHIALEDTVQYVTEMARVLRPGGVAIVHHAVNETAPAWDRIEAHNDWYRAGATLGQYYYHSVHALHRMYERAGFIVLQTSIEYCTAILTVQRPAASTAPRIEQALRRAVLAGDAPALDRASADLRAIADASRARLETLLSELAGTSPGQHRYAAVQRIRRLLRP